MKANEIAEAKKAKFSIADNYVDDAGKTYEKIVVLDTDIFNGAKFSERGKRLHDFVFHELAEKQVPLYDDDEGMVVVEFAKGKGRVQKDGAKNSHVVLEKLARKNGKRAQHAVVHAAELIEVSKLGNKNSEHSHQWLDQNGWEFRKAYLLTMEGEVLEATLNIANARDGRKVLYDINQIKDAGHGDVPLNSGSHINSSANTSVSRKGRNGKGQFSLPDENSIYDYVDGHGAKGEKAAVVNGKKYRVKDFAIEH